MNVRRLRIIWAIQSKVQRATWQDRTTKLEFCWLMMSISRTRCFTKYSKEFKDKTATLSSWYTCMANLAKPPLNCWEMAFLHPRKSCKLYVSQIWRSSSSTPTTAPTTNTITKLSLTPCSTWNCKASSLPICQYWGMTKYSANLDKCFRTSKRLIYHGRNSITLSFHSWVSFFLERTFFIRLTWVIWVVCTCLMLHQKLNSLKDSLMIWRNSWLILCSWCISVSMD